MTSDPERLITLLTDFGDRDGYVGAMKGVMLSIAPGVRLIDITHNVEPQNLAQAASILADTAPYFPPHTVHCVVVDPGVGSDRDPVAVSSARGMFVAPDNGVLTRVLQRVGEYEAVRLDNSAFWLGEDPSHTFHGRDIFSPAAAHLANGTPLNALGTAFDTLKTLTLPALSVTPGAVRGEVVRIDHFGNVLTNLRTMSWRDGGMITLVPDQDADAAPIQLSAETAVVSCGWHTIKGINRTYTEVAEGRMLALIGSSGELEIAVNQGNASERLSLEVGDPVTIRI